MPPLPATPTKTPSKSLSKLQKAKPGSAASSTASSSTTKTPTEAICSAISSDFSPANTVTLLVGPHEQHMIAYGVQLTRDSDFFAAAMKKEWAEGQTRTIKLPEESPDVAAHYLSYLYSGKLFTEDIKSVSGQTIVPCSDLLASLYVSCERYLNRKLQSAIIAEIIRLTSMSDNEGKHWIPTEKCVATVYHGTPKGSPARRLLVDLQVASGEKAWMEYEDDKTVTFGIDVINAMYAKAQCLYLRVQDLKVKDYA